MAVPHEETDSLRAWARVFLLVSGSLWLALWYCQVSTNGWCNDELAHIPAGLCHLETGNMTGYRVNPPLPRVVGAIPLLWDRPRIEWDVTDRPFSRAEYRWGGRLARDHPKQIQRWVVKCRLMMLPFACVGFWAIFQWTFRLYGIKSACLAVGLWGFNPDVITHAAVVAPDFAASCMGLLVGYQFWKWVIRDDRPFPWSVSASVAMAILCKFTWLLLLPLLPMMTLLIDLSRLRHGNCTSSGGRYHSQMAPTNRWSLLPIDAIRLCCSFLFTLTIINAAYGFDGFLKQLESFRFLSDSLNHIQSWLCGSNNLVGLGSHLPVPIPEQMLLGLDFLKFELESKRPCYLNGTWQHGGWPYFYLYAMCIKLPLATIALILIQSALSITNVLKINPARHSSMIRRSNASSDWIPILIGCVLIAAVSSQTGFTHHVRYVLPSFGFLIIYVSKAVSEVSAKWFAAIAVASLMGVANFHVSYPGQSHTFANVLFGGPNHGWKYLGHSNFDWGQSAVRIRKWLEANPERRPITVLFRSHYGLPQQLVDCQQEISFEMTERGFDRSLIHPPTGWYLVSCYQMTLPQNQIFREIPVVAQPFPDVLLFHIDCSSVDDLGR